MRIVKPQDYYNVNLERMDQALTLYKESKGKSYALSMYVAGVAVECMLRAYKMLKPSTFDEKHDLKRLFKASGMLVSEAALREKGLTEERAMQHLSEMEDSHDAIVFLWKNEYRYASEKRLLAHLKKIKFEQWEVKKFGQKVKGDLNKAASSCLLDSSQQFINKGIFL